MLIIFIAGKRLITKNHYRKSLTITPKINGDRLTKLFDTKEAVKDAIKNNDLVIVAGRRL